jgi:ribosome-associated protein
MPYDPPFVPDRIRGVTIATELSNSAPKPPVPPAPASETAKRFAVDAARLAANTRCSNVVVLDVSRVSPVTDFFVIATGSSGRQMRSVAEEIEDLGRPQGFKALGRHGHEGESSWMLTDFVDVVVHIFSPDARGYYDLDGLWGDAGVVDWQTGAPPPPNAGAAVGSQA